MLQQSEATPADVRRAAEAIRGMRDAPGFIVDLRRANGGSKPLFLWDIAPDSLEGREIMTGDHCFGCTAGAGSSCGGAIV